MPNQPDRRPRLLVVDDEASIVALLTIWFEPLGWYVRSARSGPEAVASAAAFGPDAMILDVMLPGFSGLEVLPRVRAIDPSIVVVLSTARDSDSDRVAGLAAGADDYLVKPYSLGDLQARLSDLLARPTRLSAGDSAPRPAHT